MKEKRQGWIKIGRAKGDGVRQVRQERLGKRHSTVQNTHCRLGREDGGSSKSCKI